MSTSDDGNKQSQWCLVGNITTERKYGPGGKEIRQGTKHFSAGTKVYCLPTQWGDGYDQIIVIGRHRGSKKYTTMIISSAWVENWRAQVVYSPEVIRRIEKATEEPPRNNWQSKDQVEVYVKMLLKNQYKPQNPTP